MRVARLCFVLYRSIVGGPRSQGLTVVMLTNTNAADRHGYSHWACVCAGAAADPWPRSCCGRKPWESERTLHHSWDAPTGLAHSPHLTQKEHIYQRHLKSFQYFTNAVLISNILTLISACVLCFFFPLPFLAVLSCSLRLWFSFLSEALTLFSSSRSCWRALTEQLSSEESTGCNTHTHKHIYIFYSAL